MKSVRRTYAVRRPYGCRADIIRTLRPSSFFLVQKSPPNLGQGFGGLFVFFPDLKTRERHCSGREGGAYCFAAAFLRFFLPLFSGQLVLIVQAATAKGDIQVKVSAKQRGISATATIKAD